MSELRQKLEQEIQAHNELHNNIQAGEEQLTAMKEERAARRGRVTLLQELVATEETTTQEGSEGAEEAPQNVQDPSLVEVAPDGEPEVEG